MIETDPDPSERTLYACLECGTGVENPEHDGGCPSCGGLLRNTTVAHD
jgi:rubrerythrin